MSSKTRLANAAWEALMGTHAALMKEFQAEPIWGELSMREYDVLYTLSKCSAPVSLSELNAHVLLSQPAMSRMVERLVARGLIDRGRDPADGRGVRLSLTPAGAKLQREVGRAHAVSVARALEHLEREDLIELERLCEAITNRDEVRT
ncbi:MAG: winged helix-turn-helix transcriptional regulator [Solirubrobacterales bacterium]|nr:winged helix-turn-helix transcriptional regulator [Solirubrobacterales bacterium]